MFNKFLEQLQNSTASKKKRQKRSTHNRIHRFSQFLKFSFSDLRDQRSPLLKYFTLYLKFSFSYLQNLHNLPTIKIFQVIFEI